MNVQKRTQVNYYQLMFLIYKLESKNLETYLNKAKSDLKDLNTSFEQNMNFKTSKTLFINKTIFLIKERFEIFLLKIKKDLCDLLNNDAYKDYFETFKEKFLEEISSINKNCNMIDEKFKLFKLDNSIINSVNSLESIDKLSKILESFDEKANKLVNINEVDKFLEDFTTNSEYFRNNICLYNICQNFTEAFAITQLTNITSNTSTNDINTSNTNNTNTNSNYTSYNNTYQYRNENNNGNTFFTNGSNYSNGNINNSYSGYSNYNNNRNGSNGNINQTSIFKAVKAFIPKDKRKPVEYYEHFVPIIGFKRSIHKDKEKLIVILKQRFKEFKVKTISIIEKDDELYGTQVVFEKGEDIAEFMKNKSFNLAMDNSDVYLNQKSNKDGNRFYVTYKK